MIEENRYGLGKIIGMEFVYLLLVFVLAALACLVQFLGNSHSHSEKSFLFSGDVYSYNIIMYLIGALLFIVGVFILYRFVFSKYVDKLADFSIGYSIGVWLISLVMAIVMWYCLSVEYFLLVGFGNLKPDSLLLVTVFGWPIYVTGFVGVMLIWSRSKK